jgi:hypothetical protein
VEEIVDSNATAKVSIEESIRFAPPKTNTHCFGVFEVNDGKNKGSEIPSEETFMKWPKLFAREQVEMHAPTI